MSIVTGMIYYITKDIERALGIDLNYYTDLCIITNDSPTARMIQSRFTDRVLIHEGDAKSTLELLAQFRDTITSNDQIIVFKNSVQIERLCENQNWNLLNPKAELVNTFEHKISQYQWIMDKNIRVPDTVVGACGAYDFGTLEERLGVPFIVQFNTGHTGSGTQLISNSREWENITAQFPKREARISRCIDGLTYTINTCISNSDIIPGKTSLQLTGIPELTENKFATVGNSWKDVDTACDTEVARNARAIASEMQKDGWKGLFGIDVLVEQNSKEMYFIEINARQPQSAGFETIIAHEQQANGPMDWHLQALAGTTLPFDSNEYDITAQQVFMRKKDAEMPQEYQSVVNEREERIERFYKNF